MPSCSVHSHPSLTPTQHTCPEKLYLPFLYHTLKIFVQGAEEGWYDFCSLPYAAKMQMSLPDEDTMRQIASNYDGQFISSVVCSCTCFSISASHLCFSLAWDGATTCKTHRH